SLGAAGAFGLGCSRQDKGSVSVPASSMPVRPAPELPPQAAPSADTVSSAARAPPAATSDAGPRGATRLLTLESPGAISPVAVVFVPAWVTPGERFPVLVALHGRGEALKSPPAGAMGWVRDYLLTRAFERLANPPLTAQDLEGFVEPDHLAGLNA